MKKIISILLVLATVLSCFMMTVSAEETVVSDEGRLPFEDVKDNHWFAEAVKFCYANDVINGMNEYTFGFSGQLTRAQFVMMLANLEGVDTSTYTVTQFSDVKSNHWYYGAVAWAYNEDIVSGMTETTFAPNEKLNRAQLTRIMHNYMQDKYTVEVPEDTLDRFPDKPKPAYWFYDDIKYSVAAGLISGMSDGTLNSVGTVTRAQAAVIFKNFMEQYYYGSCEHVFSEADCTNAAVCETCGLVNGLPNGHTLTAYDCVTGGKCSVCEVDVEPSTILHNFAAATCTKPMTCTRCQATRGEAKGHNWKAATCTTPKTCVVCGTKEGSAKGHNWKAATCTTAKNCVVCGTVEGSALGHSITAGTCTRCGKFFADWDFNTLATLIQSKGQYSSGSYVLLTEDSDSLTGMVYTPGETYIGIQNVRAYSNGHSDMTTLVVTKSGTVYEYVYMYANTTEYLFAGAGTLDAATFTKNTKEGFSEYEGTIKSTYTDYMNSALKEMLNDVNKILKPYGYSVKQLGFKAY